MKEYRQKIVVLILIMAFIVLTVELITIGLLYRTALNEERSRLEETAKSQARLIEAIARFNQKFSRDFQDGAYEATLKQITDAHSNYEGFGETGEFTLSKKEENKIVFLLRHRHSDRQNPKPVPLNSNLAEPMRLALSGKSGTVIDLDYRGVKVLAAHEPVAVLDLGIVAKIDLAEIKAPFVRTGLISGFFGIFMIILGAALFLRITNPMIKTMKETIHSLQNALTQVKQLSGLLPICASCKKVRDDKGYWNQIESYIRDHSEATFSHGICPDCAESLYSEMSIKTIQTSDSKKENS